MADTHHTFRFPGIYPVEQGAFTFSTGITPSVATITATFVGEPIRNAYGDLEIVYGNRKLVFRDCRLDNPDFTAGESGQAFTVRVSDRRWKWAFGEINGQYNVRTENGVDILENTKKDSRELAKLLFEAMNESGFDVKDLPSFTPAEVNWVSANPATELASLCDQGGCRIVLGLDNRVRIFKSGTGDPLPRGKRESVSFGADLPDLGDSIKAYAQNTRWEVLLELEAVGIDLDYSIQLINDLTYNPATKRAAARVPPSLPSLTEFLEGWFDQYPESLQGLFDKEDERQTGLKSIYRWYRVRRFAHVSNPDPLSTEFGKLPEFGEIDSLEQILPLLDVRVDKYFDKEAGVDKTKPVEVEGKFYDATQATSTNTNTKSRTKFRGSFSLDAERGIVQFSEPVYRFDEKSDGTPIFRPAELFLRIAIEVKSDKTREYHRASFKKSTVRGRRQNTGSLIVDDKASRLNYILEYQPDFFNTSLYRLASDHFENKDETEDALEETIKRRLSELDRKESETVGYTGIIKQELDGAIQQISWTVGEGGAATTISRHTEHDIDIPTYQRRRRNERAKAKDNDDKP